MSRSLIKAVDLSLIPASLMILGKFLGVVVTILIFNAPWTVRDYTDSLFTKATMILERDLKVITSYSDLFMYIVLALMFSLNIIRAVYLHNTHVKPTLVSRLANKNLLYLVRNSYDIYHSAMIWLLFVWVTNILVIINCARGLSFLWIGVVCTLASIILTTLLLQDVYKEIENIRKHPGQYQWQ